MGGRGPERRRAFLLPGSGRLFALQAALKSTSLRSMSLRSTSLRSTAISFCPSGRPSRGGSRPAPAPRLSGKHNRPPKAGSLSKSIFLTDQARFAPSSTRPLAASLRLTLENAFPSAFVMPLKVKTQVKSEKIKIPIESNPKPQTPNPKLNPSPCSDLLSFRH